jgi:hypothetical protein
MLTLVGKGVSPGLAKGEAFVYIDMLQRDSELYRIRPDEVGEEQARIERAIDDVRQSLTIDAKHIDEKRGRSSFFQGPAAGREYAASIRCAAAPRCCSANVAFRMEFPCAPRCESPPSPPRSVDDATVAASRRAFRSARRSATPSSPR